MRVKVILICENCVSRNYVTAHSKFDTKRLELKKYCPQCKSKTIHKESR